MAKDTPFQGMHIMEAGSGPVISALSRELGIPETINTLVDWDEKQCKLDPGTLVLALIINILHGRAPLYRVEEFFREQDTELLFGTGVESKHLNDDALGSTLDKIYDAGPKKVFSAIALTVQAREKIEATALHLDTTARLVYGNYDREGGTIRIARGYNKERRTDLKQFKVGLGVNKDGFPLLGDVMNGNLDDKTWNKEVLNKLPDIIDNLNQIIYVADSAMVTEPNLKVVQEKNLRFISRLPATFSLSAKLIERACAKEEWDDLGKLAPGENRASYKVQEYRETLCGNSYRFVVVNSSQLDKRKLKSLGKNAQQEKEQLIKEVRNLTSLSFACEPDAKEALSRFLQEKNGGFYPLVGTVESVNEKLKRHSRGRPAKSEEPQYRQVYRINLEAGAPDEEALARAKERLGCFVLISNVCDYSTDDILKEYKEQTVVENRFKFIKHPIYVGPMFLQKNERMEALSYVILMALIVYIVLQRRVRQALEKEAEPLVITGGKKSFAPTGNKVLELLSPVKILCLKKGDVVIDRCLPKSYNYLARLLTLIGFDLDVFISPRAP